MKPITVCNLGCNQDFPINEILSRKYKGNYKVTEHYFVCPHCDMEYPSWYEYQKKIYRTYQDVEVKMNAK